VSVGGVFVFERWVGSGGGGRGDDGVLCRRGAAEAIVGK